MSGLNCEACGDENIIAYKNYVQPYYGARAHWAGSLFSGKAGGPLAVGRLGGVKFTLAELTLWFQALGFFIASSTCFNIGFGLEKGDIREYWNNIVGI